jgi:Uroporphyrinogen decarboxylase (URO-D)
MAKLDRDAAQGRVVFAPLIFRLALKLEQVPWTEFSSSASEAMYVLRSAQRVFKLDAVCTWFDTWLEAEAIGMTIARDDLGACIARPDAVALPPVETVMASAPIARVIEIIRRMCAEAGEAGITLAALSAGATLIDHVAGAETRTRILAANDAGALAGKDAELLDYLRQLSLALARAYLEAGAGALLLLQEVDSPDLSEFDAFVSLLNLAAYYGTPVALLACHPLSAKGHATLDRVGIELYATPNAASPGIAPLPRTEEVEPVQKNSEWLALSRWEVDPATAPETVQSWRRAVNGP